MITINFVFDIDGTLCFDGKKIDAAICEALTELQEAGHALYFASARPIRDLLPVVPEAFHHCVMVGGNGTFTYLNEKIEVSYFEEETLTILRDCIANNQLTYLADGEWDYAFTGDMSHPIYQNIDKTSAENVPISALHRLCKLVLFNPTATVLEEVATLPVAVCHYKNEHAIDISPLGINKVRDLHPLHVEQFIDQCLFEQALHSVCVGDHEVKQYATETIRKEEIAATIKKYIQF